MGGFGNSEEFSLVCKGLLIPTFVGGHPLHLCAVVLRSPGCTRRANVTPKLDNVVTRVTLGFTTALLVVYSK